jgi:hypothetical protein
MRADPLPDGQSPTEVLSLSSTARLAYFRSLTATNPTAAALFIQTCLEHPDPVVALSYLEQLVGLIEGAEPIATYLLAARFIDTPNNSGPALLLHQEASSLLYRRLSEAGLHTAYVGRMGDELASGTLRRRILPTPGSPPLKAGDQIIYYPDRIQWESAACRRGTVLMIQVSLDDLTWT